MSQRFLTVIGISIVGLLLFLRPAVAADLDAMEKKLDTILKNQEKFSQQLDEIKTEIQIVKARATS